LAIVEYASMSQRNTAVRRPRVIPDVVQQHVDEAVFLHTARTGLLRAPHVRLQKLQGFEDRLSAHLEGLGIAGEAARPLCEAALESARPGTLFVATIRALDSCDWTWLESLFAISEKSDRCRSGLFAAFGWTPREMLRGVVAQLFGSADPFARLVALAACSQHRVDPDLGQLRIFEDTDPAVRARAYRTAGELGRREFVSRLGAAVTTEEADCQFWAAWAAVLLGDRRDALEVLARFAAGPNSFRDRALPLALQAMSVAAGHGLLRSIAPDPAQLRLVIRGSGWVGDPSYVPWLIGFMDHDGLARIAGEAFTLITGVNGSAWLDLERLPPERLESGPNDDPTDANVDMDEDDGLPWPDAVKVQAWWHANGQRFQPGMRYFMGQPLNRDDCLRVLKEGFQRQRIAAARYLALLNPGTPLFEWRAPARRQQRLLAEMT